MSDHFLEIRIVQPGRVIGQYYPIDSNTLRLEKITYPEEDLPFDVGMLPTALSPFNEPLTAIVLGSVSHPVNTEIESKLLGALERSDGIPVLLTSPTVDERAPQCVDQISLKQRAEIIEILNRAYPGDWRWLTIAEVEPELHTATIRYREKQDRDTHRVLDPAWKPLNVGRPTPSFAEAERYSAAEYTFFELPSRFQHYISDYLAPDERVLYAARRPAMPSQRRRSWLRREHLQEGVLILTNQRLIHLAELVPPDSANVRYGYHTSIGALERLVDVSLSGLGDESLLLSTTWTAHGGKTSIEWEMPVYLRASLEEMTAMLGNFIADDPDECQLRRASYPQPPDKLPRLSDSASNDLENLVSLNEMFSAALGESLKPGEKAQAWALLPEAQNGKKGAQALVVTEERMFLLADHSFEVPLTEVTTLEYTSSILESSLAINFVADSRPRRKVILFPYPSQGYFHKCFEAAWRCMAVRPLR